MLRKLFLITTAAFAFLAMSTAALADEWLKSIPEFELTDQLGATHTLDKYADKDFPSQMCQL